MWGFRKAKSWLPGDYQAAADDLGLAPKEAPNGTRQGRGWIGRFEVTIGRIDGVLPPNAMSVMGDGPQGERWGVAIPGGPPRVSVGRAGRRRSVITTRDAEFDAAVRVVGHGESAEALCAAAPARVELMRLVASGGALSSGVWNAVLPRKATCAEIVSAVELCLRAARAARGMPADPGSLARVPAGLVVPPRV